MARRLPRYFEAARHTACASRHGLQEKLYIDFLCLVLPRCCTVYNAYTLFLHASYQYLFPLLVSVITLCTLRKYISICPNLRHTASLHKDFLSCLPYSPPSILYLLNIYFSSNHLSPNYPSSHSYSSSSFFLTHTMPFAIRIFTMYSHN